MDLATRLLQRSQQRQMVVHGHITLNGHKVDRPSYQVKVGMTIQVREKTLNTDFSRARLEEYSQKPT